MKLFPPGMGSSVFFFASRIGHKINSVPLTLSATYLCPPNGPFILIPPPPRLVGRHQVSCLFDLMVAEEVRIHAEQRVRDDDEKGMGGHESCEYSVEGMEEWEGGEEEGGSSLQGWWDSGGQEGNGHETSRTGGQSAHQSAHSGLVSDDVLLRKIKAHVFHTYMTR